MSSWNEKPHVKPTVNVNLAQCRCAGIGDEHLATCPAKPVLIPCPIQRSVTFTVRLGECRCAEPRSEAFWMTTKQTYDGQHWSACSGRPIRVSCSITSLDGSWEKSDVAVVEVRASFAEESAPAPLAALNATRDRWALVKALMLNHPVPARTEAEFALWTQRDAVYAALCEMARSEDATCAARDAVREARGLPLSKPLEPGLRESAIEMGDYVERLIEQVGILGVLP